jgi:hypothetical protein
MPPPAEAELTFAQFFEVLPEFEVLLPHAATPTATTAKAATPAAYLVPRPNRARRRRLVVVNAPPLRRIGWYRGAALAQEGATLAPERGKLLLGRQVLVIRV